jgi:hypothetical protein
MAEGEVYGFEAGTVERIRDAVRGFEERPLIPLRELENWFPSDVPSVEIVRVTSTTTTNGEYPGKLQIVNPLPTPPTYTDGIDCWVIGPNGETLSAQRYLARADGDGNTPLRARYIASFSAAGGAAATQAAVIRVPSAGLANTLTAAFIESANDGTPPTFIDGLACWALDMNLGIVNPGRHPGIWICTHSDGKQVFAVESGYTGVKLVCESDQTNHTWTFARGKLITAP